MLFSILLVLFFMSAVQITLAVLLLISQKENKLQKKPEIPKKVRKRYKKAVSEEEKRAFETLKFIDNYKVDYDG